MQALLDVKEAAEKQAKAAFASASRAADEAEKTWKNCLQEALLERETLEADAENGIAAMEYQTRCSYIGLLRQRAAQLEEEMCKARKNARNRQLALQQIYQDKKVLERVRSAQKRTFIKEQSMKEAKEMDDLLMPRMARKSAQ